MSPTLQTLLPAAAGVAVVVLGILVFRLHAFLALVLAAAVTGALTPPERLDIEALREQGHVADFLGIERPWHENDRRRYKFQYVLTNPISSTDTDRIRSPYYYREWVVIDPERYVETGETESILRVRPSTRNIHGKATHILVARLQDAPQHVLERHLFMDAHTPLSQFYRPRPTDVIVRRRALPPPPEPRPPVPTRIATAFGGTVGSIGLLIAFAAVIGMCLLDSGAADRIVRSALKVVGERGAPVAFAGCGFLLGVPVFFDTVFLLMIPLGKAMRLRTGRNYILYVLTIVCGATMAHSLVPPTPGPLLVAEALDVDIGTMMVVGSAVGLITAGYGILHAIVANRWIEVPLRDTPDMPLADLERLSATPDHELPPLWASLLPIVLPVMLIAQQTALEVLLEQPPASLASAAANVPAWFVTAVNVVGEKNTAVGIGLVAALALLTWQTRQTLGQVRDRVGAALASGGLIILITAAGGAFGKMIEQTGVASLLQEMPAYGPAGLLTVAFLVTTAIRTAQGSATVAMITAVGLFAGIELPFHAVWLALAIGCGSKPFSWMTDSGFWVICKMSGMTEAETLKTLTPMTAMMGFVGLGTVITGASLFPMK